jgi:hypothetical protein
MTHSFKPAFLALLGAALLSGCGVSGPPDAGFVPPVVDMHTDLGKIEGSAVLAAPAGWIPAPTVTTPVFQVSAPRLLAAMQDILLASPRTWLTGSHPEQGQASFIVRSVAMNLPDIVVVQAIAASDQTSKAVILSRSRFDVLPFSGSNEGRVRRLIKALTDRFGVVPGTGVKS